ncbi:MAG: hypothetical protein KAS39_00750, partial [Actinomycetia bacterium]|nr:hypothetical protein [Actinomycetes bacterium]
ISLEIRTLGQRLDGFLPLIKEELISNFKRGDLGPIVDSLDELIKKNIYVKEEIEKLKFNENIKTYTNEEIVNFYYNYFYRRLIEVLPRNKTIIDQLPYFSKKVLADTIKKIPR